MSSRGRGLGGKPLDADSPLLGGRVLEVEEPVPEMGAAPEAGAGAEESNGYQEPYEPNADELSSPPEPSPDARQPSRPAGAAAGQRGGALARRLGALGAGRLPARAGAQLLLPLLVPGRDRGDRERPLRGRRPARLQPLRGAAARRADGDAGDPQRAPAPAAALHARRALVQGLSRDRDADQQDRDGRRPPRKRPAAPLRRGTPGDRLPGGPEGVPQGLLAALPAAPLRPRRLRPHGDQGAGADRPDRADRRRGGDADLRPPADRCSASAG